MERNIITGPLGNATGEKTAQERKQAGYARVAQQALTQVRSGSGRTARRAETYPQRADPVDPAASRGRGDGHPVLGRLIGTQLAERLGQPVVPEKPPRRSPANIGTEAAAKSKPDGYTIAPDAADDRHQPQPSQGSSTTTRSRILAPIALVAQIPQPRSSSGRASRSGT